MRSLVSMKMGLFLAVTALATSCTSNSSTTSESASVSNGMTSLVSSVKTQINGVSGILDAPASLFSVNPKSNQVSTFSSFSTAWTSTSSPGIQDPTSSSMSKISFQSYMGQQLQPTLLSSGGGAINAFGRMSQAFQIFCAMGVAANINSIAVNSFGYIDNGTYTITFTSSLKSSMTSTCGIDTSNITTDASMTMTVATASNSYDKVITFSLFNQSYYVKNDASVLRVATAEITSNGYSRTMAEYNKTTTVTRAEAVYVNGPSQNSSVELFRIYYDQTLDEGMVLGYRGSSTGVTQATRYLLAGKPTAGDGFSLSLRSDVDFSNTNSYEACVLAATGNIDTDGSRCTASSTRLAGGDISSAATIISNFYTTYSGQTAAADWGTAGLGDSDAVAFTSMANLVTTAFTP